MMVPVMAAIVVTASFQGRKRGAGGAGERGLLLGGRAAALGRDADRLDGPGGVVQVPAGIAFCDEEDAAGAQPRPEDVDALCERAGGLGGERDPVAGSASTIVHEMINSQGEPMISAAEGRHLEMPPCGDR